MMTLKQLITEILEKTTELELGNIANVSDGQQTLCVLEVRDHGEIIIEDAKQYE
jgi:hypothetical protein